MTRRPNLDLDLPAAHRYARVGRRVARSFARLEGLCGQGLEDLSLVVSELLSNCVDHGGGGGAMEAEDREGDVRMRLELAFEAERWELLVSDQGGGRVEDLEPFLDAEPEVALLDERGRGFLLLRDLVDGMAVEASADGRGLAVRAWRAGGERKGDA